jgi:glycine/D-amino acid oxidase-like deaminating enzyme
MNSDVIIVGSGIVGLACAWAALQQGKSVRVIDRDPFCVGASIRNFGFVTVTGQGRGDTWRRARRSRDVWASVAPQAGIAIEHQGLYVLAQRPQAKVVLQELCKQAEGQDLQWLEGQALQDQAPQFVMNHLQGALYSPHDMRSLFPEAFSQNNTQLCQLQMLRVQPPDGYKLGAGVMSDLSLVRYRGYSELPGSQLLLDQLRVEASQELAHGIHLIVVQSHDGSLVVGDSHHYGQAMRPFASREVEDLILHEMQRLLCLGHYQVTERWTGIYPSAPQDSLVREVLPGVQLVSVTSGTGMSTSFGLAEEIIQNWSTS